MPKTAKASYKITRLINYPAIVTVGDLEKALLHYTPAAKKLFLKIIFHRLYNRYFRPLNNICPPEKRSGFLMMAAGCLVIEALQSFREGKEYTERGAGAGTFRKFFSENNAFSQLTPFSDQFYRNIRCGVLHQAETYEDWKIILQRGAPLFDSVETAIHADIFLEELARIIRDYCRHLNKADWTDLLWKRARSKLEKICEHHTLWAYCI